MATVPCPIPDRRSTPPEAYEALGLRCGLEVHQQLLTERKLFCRCPAGPYRNDFDAEILRHLRPTLSEMGRFDPTALMEQKTKKEIVYQITGDTTCTYEMDDAPPFGINEQAVDIVLEICLLLDSSIVGELQIARKQYLDGSIPTGFQRTAVVGLGGSVPFMGRRLGIEMVAIEEDACREIRDRGHRRTFRTDRLSRPLAEVVTPPELGTPDEAGRAARLLSRLLRATGKVRTGPGALRTDLNVSIRGGTRVEIKGVPRIPWIGDLVHHEAFRQRALLQIRDRLREGGLTPGGFRARTAVPGRSATLLRIAPLRRGLRGGAEALVVLLPGLRETLDHPLGPTRTFADELVDQARVVACLDDEPNHLRESGPLAPAQFWRNARAALGAGAEDGLLLLWGPREDLDTAVEEIEDRCRFALMGIPGESRQVLPSGETRFERVLPGPDRMYPDTDLPPLAITDARIDAIEERLSPPVWEREERMISQGVAREDAALLAVSPLSQLLADAVRVLDVPAAATGRALGSTLTALGREGVATGSIPREELLTLLTQFAAGAFAPEAFPDLLRLMASGEGAETAIRERVGPVATEEEVLAQVRTAVAGSPEIRDPVRRARHLMGVAMWGLRGRAPGAVVRRALDSALEEDDR